MLVIGLGVFMGTLDMSIVSIALPTLVERLDTSFVTIQWVMLGNLLVITSMMLGVARLGDMHGKKKLYTAGLLIFTVGSLLCGLAPNVGWLIGFRVVQGCGMVMLQALGTAIVVEIFPEEERGRALGIMSSIVSVGIAVGPAIGGIIIGLIDWRWIFLVNVPVGLITFTLAVRLLPSRNPDQTGERFDGSGAFIITLSLVCFALGMTMGQNRGFDDGLVQFLLIISGIGVVVFVITEARIRHPMVDLSLFRDPLFSVNLVMGFLSFLVMGGLFILPFFLQLVKGYPTHQIGLMMMVLPVAMGITSPLSGDLADRYGTRVISIVGLVLVAAGFLTLSTLRAETSVLGFILRMAPLGIGMGVFQSPNNSAIMGAVPQYRLGVASGLLALSRNLGNSAGLPLAGAVFNSIVLSTAGIPAQSNVTDAPAEALVRGVSGTYRVAVYVMFAAVFLSFIALWLDRRRRKDA
ncbi:MAG: DHA2 family efflux MFS transporter permease subunit [Deltaproteobacteria bacterium]|nr:DHA2 family efflux MFS transporter permease subunit [Deltaproteobacteria bacterium]